MVSLSGLSAVPGGYQAAQASMMALAQKQAEQDAAAAYGNTLAYLAQQGQGAPAGVPNLPVMPSTVGKVSIAPPAPSSPQPSSNPRVDALTAALAAKGFTNVAPTAPQAPAAPAAPPSPSAAQAPAASPSPRAQPQISLPSTAGVQPGTLSWSTVVNAVKAANPKVSPAALAGAVNQFLPLMDRQSQEKWKAIDAQRQQFEANTARMNADRLSTANGSESVADVIEKIYSGDYPPPGASGQSRVYPAAFNQQIIQGMAKVHPDWNLTAHLNDWSAMQKMVTAQNSPQTTRFVAAIDSASAFLDKFKNNVDAWSAAGFPTIVNQTVLDQALKGQLPTNDPQGAQRQAALLSSQYRDLISLLASVFSSGGVPTDSARRLAQEQIDLGWSAGTIDAVINQIQGLLDDRKGAIRGVGPYTPGGAPNAYAPTPPSGGVAPEGTLVQMQDGSYQIKRNGQWVPYQ